jgi:cobyrinic acid a,c-diamide synthase
MKTTTVSGQTPTPGLVIAAPASGSGKTMATLALLRAFRSAGQRVASCKIGPDYIDPAFHAAASGRACVNLDPWAMRPEMLALLIDQAGRDADLLLVEGVMGLYDGAADGSGSTADLAAFAGWPVVLVVDASGQGVSAAATVQGFRDFRRDVEVAGVIFNRVGGPRHAAILKDALAPLGIACLGCLPRALDLALPGRHLGLVQAQEHIELETFLARAGEWATQHVDLPALQHLARPARIGSGKIPAAIPPLGQRIALASDQAFAFAYPHLIEGWRSAGAAILPFAPLADEAPDEKADAVYLPGGYPELHAGRLAANGMFLDGLRRLAARGAAIYGECGGYMMLGAGLVDASGARHAMAGLLPLETSFADPRLHLGYREVRLARGTPLGAAGTVLRGHEFHYATVVSETANAPLFTATDAVGRNLGALGALRGSVMGSFIHLIDCR